MQMVAISQTVTVSASADIATKPDSPATPSKPANTGAPAQPTSTSASIAGKWTVVFNTYYHGEMEFTQAGTGWKGTLNLDAGPEPLSNISFNPTTGAINFTRTNAGQVYTGKLSGNKMEGMFDGTAPWSAARIGQVSSSAAPGSPTTSSTPTTPPAKPATPSAPAQPASTSVSITGKWTVIFNTYYHGEMEFSQAGTGWKGTLNLDAGPEPLSNISFNPRTGAINFTRTNAGQVYTGKLSGNKMEGMFDGTAPWSATRIGQVSSSAAPGSPTTSATPTTPPAKPVTPSAPAQPASTSVSITGKWTVIFNTYYHGEMEFTQAGTGWKGTLNLDAGPEPLSNISFNPTSGAISFTRTNAGQVYTGKLSGNKMEGMFDGAYPWSATRK